MSIFSKRLKEKREEIKKSDSKWTQAYMANKIGVARPTYTAYELGTKEPPQDTLNKIADLLNVSSDFLIGRTEQHNEHNSLTEIEKIIKDLGIESFFFKDIEAWKNLTPEDVAELKRHFEYVAHKAKERNESDKME